MIANLYVLMCKKSKEINSLWGPKLEDKIYEKLTGKVSLLCFNEEAVKDYDLYMSSTEGRYDITLFTNYVWLPSQEQLQEIYIKSINKSSTNIKIKTILYASRKMKSIYRHSDTIFTSIEQLWLCLIMKEIFNQRWDGKNWILI